jgi:hypothetical protein
MKNTIELKKVKLVLDENQLCTLITMARNGQANLNDGHTKADKIEVMYILNDALDHSI